MRDSGAALEEGLKKLAVLFLVGHGTFCFCFKEGRLGLRHGKYHQRRYDDGRVDGWCDNLFLRRSDFVFN